jgi:hypothetical protein
VVAAGVFLPPVVVPCFVPLESDINCEYRDINIKTGQVRTSRYLWYVKVSERVENTFLSRTLAGKVIDAASGDPWRRTRSGPLAALRGRCILYRFGAAPTQIRTLELLCDMYALTPDEVKEMATQVLSLWQTAGDCSAAGKFIEDTMRTLDANKKADASSAPAATSDGNAI